MAWYWWLASFWATGWTVHEIIIVHGWWSGRLYWKPMDVCPCDDCKGVRRRNKKLREIQENEAFAVGNIANRIDPDPPEIEPHGVPHRLETYHILTLGLAGFFAWYGFLIAEGYEFLDGTREKHLALLRKQNRPLEEVARELNEMFDEERKKLNDLIDEERVKQLEVKPLPEPRPQGGVHAQKITE
jgi:hypothetical protein